MSEPILSREEVGALWIELSGRPFVEGSLADSFSKRLEAAVLEKVCGEPVGFITNVGGYWHMEPTVDWEKIGLSTRLYAINRSKA